MKEIDISEFSTYAKALHCPSRWMVVDLLRSGPKSSEEIFQLLKEKVESRDKSPNECNGECGNGIKKFLSKPSFYYHLRELESAGIIELHEYKSNDKRKAPEKVWRLKIDKFFVKLNE